MANCETYYVDAHVTLCKEALLLIKEKKSGALDRDVLNAVSLPIFVVLSPGAGDLTDPIMDAKHDGLSKAGRPADALVLSAAPMTKLGDDAARKLNARFADIDHCSPVKGDETK